MKSGAGSCLHGPPPEVLLVYYYFAGGSGIDGAVKDFLLATVVPDLSNRKIYGKVYQ